MKKPLFPKRPDQKPDDPKELPEKKLRRPGRSMQCLYGPPTLLQPVKPRRSDDDEDKKTKI